MDDRLQKALDFSNYRVSLFNQKENIKLKIETLLTFAINGGIFKISPELISFVKNIKDMGHDYVVLIDMNQNPIEIQNLENFLNDITSKYFEATNYYYVEYTKLRKLRSVKEQFDDIINENK
jgi:hypothetical protein